MTRTASFVSQSGISPNRRPAEPEVFPQVGPWQPVRLIGEGALTQVFQARPVTGRLGMPASYAVKVLRSEHESDPRAVALIRREARLGCVLSHPRVIPILAYHVHESPYYVAMPYLSGSTLESHLATYSCLDLPQSLWIARQVAEGLEALHSAYRVIHADVKPSNIFASSDGHVTLLDLGYTRVADECISIADRPVVGTISYMAPEMITSSLAADRRSDIYSLGVTLYQMLSGQLPFASDNPADVAVLQKEAAPPPLKTLAPHIPTAVAQLVHQMLAKEPLRRPQTAGELVDRLARLEIEFFAERSPAPSQ